MVFYFTGTGNSLYAAKSLDENCISIPQIMHSESLIFAAERIGIVCPIYGHEMPQMVKDFLQRATLHTAYLYLVLTYGARHANAVELAEGVLKSSRKQAHYITTLRMVDNFLPVSDMNEEIAKDKAVEEHLAQIKADIAEKRHWKQPVTPKDTAVHEQYLASVSHTPETVWPLFRVTEECIGCGICTKVCPAGSIYLDKQRAIHTDENCQVCFACIHACPKLAIHLNIPEKNEKARYRNPHTTLSELVSANDQTDK